MFNDYNVDGDVTKLILNNSDRLVLISTCDLENLKSLGYSFSYHKRSGYVCMTLYCGPKGNRHAVIKHENIQTLVIGRENIPDGYNVDHINHDVFDNRRENLRVISFSDNSCNRGGENKNNRCGHRNVSWNSRRGLWQVSLMKNGRRIDGGLYEDPDEAGMVAEKLRREFYGEFAGVGKRAMK